MIASSQGKNSGPSPDSTLRCVRLLTHDSYDKRTIVVVVLPIIGMTCFSRLVVLVHVSFAAGVVSALRGAASLTATCPKNAVSTSSILTTMIRG